uniref:(northern house mosquito) hypothetical protein n=2 Tax=Culex pipiens TaxID=7175 RepID=A0A8D8CDL0_CULPI
MSRFPFWSAPLCDFWYDIYIARFGNNLLFQNYFIRKGTFLKQIFIPAGRIRFHGHANQRGEAVQKVLPRTVGLLEPGEARRAGHLRVVVVKVDLQPGQEDEHLRNRILTDVAHERYQLGVGLEAQATKVVRSHGGRLRFQHFYLQRVRHHRSFCLDSTQFRLCLRRH